MRKPSVQTPVPPKKKKKNKRIDCEFPQGAPPGFIFKTVGLWRRGGGILKEEWSTEREGTLTDPKEIPPGSGQKEGS
jgi:hypothetical protein